MQKKNIRQLSDPGQEIRYTCIAGTLMADDILLDTEVK